MLEIKTFLLLLPMLESKAYLKFSLIFFWLAAFLFNSEEAVFSQSSCQGTVNSVIKEIKQKGISKVLLSTYPNLGEALTQAAGKNLIYITLTSSNS